MKERLTEAQLTEKLTTAAAQVMVGSLYQHYKGGIYKVLDLAVLESTNEVCVLHQAQYGKQLKFIRTVDVWLETVEYNGATVPRFTRYNKA